MKNFLIIFFFLFLSSHLNAQNSGKIIYKKALQLNTDNPKINEEKLAKSIDRLEYILEFSKHESRFYLGEQLNNDSDPYANMSKRIGGSNGNFYKSTADDFTLQQQTIFNRDFLVKIKQPDFVITKESKIIDGYRAYKATAKEVIQAPNPNLKDLVNTIEIWFTPDIPIPFGPLGYNGLPGLVLHVSINNVEFYLSELEFYKNENLKLERPSGGPILSEDEFNNKLKEIVENLK